MSMKKIILPLLFSAVVLVTAAQDLNINHYPFYRDGLNPGSFFQDYDVNALVLYNNEFWNFAAEPNTELFDISLNFNGHKIGLMVLNDIIGLDRAQNLKLRFAKEFGQRDKFSFSFGLGVGVIHKYLETTGMTFQQNDDPLSYSDISHWIPDFDFGGELKTENFLFGISTNHIGKYLSKYSDINPITHYYTYAQYIINSKGNFQFHPNVLMRNWKNTYWGEAGIIVMYDHKLWAGTSFTSYRDLCFTAGVRFAKNFFLGYAFKSNLNPNILNPFTTDSHEIFLNFGIYNNRFNRLKTPRFM
jgi:type IX secretion system PorP/SprF family membrane protein